MIIKIDLNCLSNMIVESVYDYFLPLAFWDS